MTKRVILMVLMMAGVGQAADFIIGDSTNGTSFIAPAVTTAAWAGRYNSEGTLKHMMYTAVAGDSITTFSAVYRYGSEDSLLVGLYTATASDTLPDTLINSWYVVMTEHTEAQALTTWNIDYAIPSDNWGDNLMVGWILFEGAGGSFWNADSSVGSPFDMITKDAVPDSLLPATWVESATSTGSPTAWFEGLNVAATAAVSIGKANIRKATIGK